MNHDDKLSAILRMGFDDGPLAEALARKLTADDIRQLDTAIKEILRSHVQWRCESIMKIPRQKDRLAEIDRLAERPQPPGR